MYYISRIYLRLRDLKHEIPNIAKYTLQKLQWYPIITILCWVPAGVLDFYIIMTKEDSGSLRDLNMVVVALAISQGLFNSVVFFTMNPQVRHKWWVLLSTGKFSVALPVAGTANSSDVSRQSEQAEPVEAQYDYRPSSLLKKSKDTRESELPMYLGKPSQGDTSFSAAAASLPGRGGGVGGEVVSPIQEFREDSAAGWNCF